MKESDKMNLNDKVLKTIDNLEKRNIKALYIEDKSKVLEKVLELIPENSTVGFGNSQTLKHFQISEALLHRGNVVYDKTKVKSQEEKKILKKKALLADWFVTGTNAISQDGQIVNIDHSGNRVAAMIYGPEHVLIIVGLNKIVGSLELAVNRARSVAAPLNAERAGLNPPCLAIKHCVDCRSSERVCNSLVIIEGQNVKNRITVLIVGDNFGF